MRNLYLADQVTCSNCSSSPRHTRDGRGDSGESGGVSHRDKQLKNGQGWRDGSQENRGQRVSVETERKVLKPGETAVGAGKPEGQRVGVETERTKGGSAATEQNQEYVTMKYERKRGGLVS
jgi:hypothetical protein